MIKLPHPSRRFSINAVAGCFGLGLLAASGSVVAAGHQAPVHVKVSYELRVPLASAELEFVNEALDQSAKMVYHRINLECEEMLKQFATSCELTKLNVQHGRRSGRRQKESESVTVRANASFAVQLRKPQAQ